ncbi:MAG: hypothetical protein F6J94_21655 [Moorea sp. SIO1F2]|uniref:hypothetical protein n=1 Tax=unclassified Moorena TaxID=2683338 RepID=UPI0013B8AC58|nr:MULTISPECIES: hypothetical protein [unclassified Moorena]NEN99724.1 hypothetical protein [Moorena sp. SIO3I7]NEO09360.1 hypothetical protein [Moorena sp. SIO3I8]NEO21743.1 hypothetical protein [Moorena sp. SIO4A5]NEP25365.1 hypothetical protein [Moorena sp. SIO3I6]NEQ57628.1 hypothetical protein [Moorena sp. SIO4A1]
MLLIRDIVKQALTTGYLTIEAEDKLRRMLHQKHKKYDLADLDAFMVLQEAAMTGRVRQQSREQMNN